MKKKYSFVIGIVIIALAGVFYYGLSPLWTTVHLEEAAPLSARAMIESREIVSTKTHPASGSVSVLQSESKFVLRYEDLKTINGPDLKVYLSTDLDAKEFVSLGPLKATEGNVNYDIPFGTDLQKYHYALVWCEQFGVLFNYANIAK